MATVYEQLNSENIHDHSGTVRNNWPGVSVPSEQLGPGASHFIQLNFSHTSSATLHVKKADWLWDPWQMKTS